MHISVLICTLIILNYRINSIEIPYNGIKVSKSAEVIYNDLKYLYKNMTEISTNFSIDDFSDFRGNYWNKQQLTISNINFQYFHSNLFKISHNSLNFTDTGIFQMKGSGNAFSLSISFDFTYKIDDLKIDLKSNGFSSYESTSYIYSQNYVLNSPNSNINCGWKQTSFNLTKKFNYPEINSWINELFQSKLLPYFTFMINLELDNYSNRLLDNYNSIKHQYPDKYLEIQIVNKYKNCSSFSINSNRYISFNYYSALLVTGRPYLNNIFRMVYSKIDDANDPKYDLSICYNLDLFWSHLEIKSKTRYYFTVPKENQINMTLEMKNIIEMRPELSDSYDESEKVTIGCRPDLYKTMQFVDYIGDKLIIRYPWYCLFEHEATGINLLNIYFNIQTYFKAFVDLTNNAIYFTSTNESIIYSIDSDPHVPFSAKFIISEKFLPFTYLSDDFVVTLASPGYQFPELRSDKIKFKGYRIHPQELELCTFFDDNEIQNI